MNKISAIGFHYCKLNQKENSSLKNDQNPTKLKLWKIVANEKCTAQIGELSSVKNLFWVNHASKKLKTGLNRRYLDVLLSLKK